MNCVLTGVPTSRNFKGYPVHPDVLTIARYIRDAKRDKHKEKHPYSKERFNLRQILVENKSEIFAELAVRHKTKHTPVSYTHLTLPTKRIV